MEKMHDDLRNRLRNRNQELIPAPDVAFDQFDPTRLDVLQKIRAHVFYAPGHRSDIDELWRESLASAIWAHAIARVRGGDEAAGFVCGLLHAIGRAGVMHLMNRIESQRRMVCDARTYSLLLDEFEDEFAREIVDAWGLPRRVAAAVLGWRNYQVVSPWRQEAAVTHAARQLATACLHPALLHPEYLLSNPVFRELNLDSAVLGELLVHSEEVRRFVWDFGAADGTAGLPSILLPGAVAAPIARTGP